MLKRATQQQAGWRESSERESHCRYPDDLNQQEQSSNIEYMKYYINCKYVK